MNLGMIRKLLQCFNHKFLRIEYTKMRIEILKLTFILFSLGTIALGIYLTIEGWDTSTSRRRTKQLPSKVGGPILITVGAITLVLSMAGKITLGP
jgi:hypothetical protein